jgi:hypothetical protein
MPSFYKYKIYIKVNVMFTTEPARLRTVHFHPCWVFGTFTSVGPVLAQPVIVRTLICKRSNTVTIIQEWSRLKFMNNCGSFMSFDRVFNSTHKFTSEYWYLI